MLLTTRYAEDVTNGKITAGKKVILACERHLNDLSRQGTDDFPYVFDEEKGYRPIEFSESFCKPSQGNFDKLELQPWDHFWMGSIYGWVHKDTGLRRFREAVIFVARKQGKTTKNSAISLYSCGFDGEKGARVYQLANSMKQSRLVFDECQAMIKVSPLLKKHFASRRDNILFDIMLSKIEPQAADSEKLDGLNCHLGIFDEIHEFKNYKLINVIKNSTGSREQPLLIYITTAGYVLDGPLMDMYEKGADVLDGVIEDDRVFYYMAEIDENDDVEDHNNWIKANPNMGISVQLDDMIEEWNSRKHIPAERNDFITKRLNVFVQADEQSFVDLAVLKRNNKHLDLDTLKGAPCIGGFDLSTTEDFTAACLEFPIGNGYIFLLSHSFIPDKKVKQDNENLPYRDWEKKGLLTICPGDYVDHSYVYDWFIEQSKLYSISLITYDPANAFRLVQDLQVYGGEDWTKVTRQGALTLSPSIKDMKQLLLDGKVIYNEDPLMRWYINNIRLAVDNKNNWTFAKQGLYKKIDGAAAWANSHTEVMKLMPREQPQTEGVGFVSVKDLLGR